MRHSEGTRLLIRDKKQTNTTCLAIKLYSPRLALALNERVGKTPLKHHPIRLTLTITNLLYILTTLMRPLLQAASIAALERVFFEVAWCLTELLTEPISVSLEAPPTLPEYVMGVTS